jgi:hypothetical protein
LVILYNFKNFLTLYGFSLIIDNIKSNSNTIINEELIRINKLTNLENYSSFISCGVDLRIYIPIIFLKIKILAKKKKTKIYYWGSMSMNNCFAKMLGNNLRIFKFFIEGKH